MPKLHTEKLDSLQHNTPLIQRFLFPKHMTGANAASHPPTHTHLHMIPIFLRDLKRGAEIDARRCWFQAHKGRRLFVSRFLQKKVQNAPVKNVQRNATQQAKKPFPWLIKGALFGTVKAPRATHHQITKKILMSRSAPLSFSGSTRSRTRQKTMLTMPTIRPYTLRDEHAPEEQGWIPATNSTKEAKNLHRKKESQNTK